MGQKKTPGLIFRRGIWHIDKRIHGRRICQSTGTDSLREAEQFLARRTEEIRQAEIYGVRPRRTFEQAAAKYLLENQHKRSLSSDVGRLAQLIPVIGAVHLDRIHIGALQPWIEKRKGEGVSTGTINHGLKVVRRILNLAASEWIDEYGLTWLSAAPKVKLLPDKDKRKPYPLSWDEQNRLLRELPAHLAAMGLFAANSGCRDGEICGLRWEWEVRVPELGGSIFIIPGRHVKNGDDRLVVLNRIAQSIVEGQRGKHPTHVFAFRGRPVQRMLNSAWIKARRRAGLPQVRVHDLKHTFGFRLRAAGVSFEDRQDLLGHRSGRITTHYSAPDIRRLVEAANGACDKRDDSRPAFVLMQGTGGR